MKLWKLFNKLYSFSEIKNSAMNRSFKWIIFQLHRNLRISRENGNEDIKWLTSRDVLDTDFWWNVVNQYGKWESQKCLFSEEAVSCKIEKEAIEWARAWIHGLETNQLLRRLHTISPSEPNSGVHKFIVLGFFLHLSENFLQFFIFQQWNICIYRA
jgi:hypothetical protein